jgi:hypothetical protein
MGSTGLGWGVVAEEAATPGPWISLVRTSTRNFLIVWKRATDLLGSLLFQAL